MTTIVETLEQLSLEYRGHTPKKDGIELRGSEKEHHNGYKTRRGIDSYELNLNFNLLGWLSSVLYARSIDKQDESFVVLDLGCGSGRFLSEVESLHSSIVGYGITLELFEDDYSRDKIITASYNDSSLHPYVMPDIPDDSIDFVVSNFSFCHSSDSGFVPLLFHVHRILKPGCIAVLDVGGCYMDRTIELSIGDDIPIDVHYKDTNNNVYGITIIK